MGIKRTGMRQLVTLKENSHRGTVGIRLRFQDAGDVRDENSWSVEVCSLNTQTFSDLEKKKNQTKQNPTE